MLFNVFNVFMLNFLVDSFKPIKSTRKQLVIAIFWHVPKVNNNLTFDFLFSIYKSMIHYPSLNHSNISACITASSPLTQKVNSIQNFLARKTPTHKEKK